MFCRFCGAKLIEEANFCDQCGGTVKRSIENISYNQPELEYKKQQGLLWAHFLGYFGIWAGVLLNAVVLIRYFTGQEYLQYGIDPEIFYYKYGLMRIIDILYELSIIGIIVIAVKAAISIIGYKKDSGKYVCLLYILNGIVPFVYQILILLIADGQLGISPTFLVSITICFSMARVNKNYFNDRREIFVN